MNDFKSKISLVQCRRFEVPESGCQCDIITQHIFFPASAVVILRLHLGGPVNDGFTIVRSLIG
jgi:hypothetical protein